MLIYLYIGVFVLSVGGEGPVAGSVPAVMTIFYGGRVFVFDDFPPGKLKAIAGLALTADSGGSETQETMISSDESPGTVPAATGKGMLHARSGSLLEFIVFVLRTIPFNPYFYLCTVLTHSRYSFLITRSSPCNQCVAA